MLRNTVATTLTYFYPFGNTPAICLTQHLPPEQDVDLLLLGCGDVRNVLFTIYASLAAADRKFDFTCCDIEPAIVARNILLLSLIIDDQGDTNSALLWNIYYHVRVDSASLSLLDCQATKLLALSDSITTWNNGTYGRTIQFCDAQTLMQVRSIWRGYITGSPHPDQRRIQEKTLENALARAKSTRQIFLGKNGIQLTGARSAAPISFSALRDLSSLAEDYWDKGCLHTGETLSASTHLNPCVLYTGCRDPVLHYGADPLLGFHLATAYVPLHDLEASQTLAFDKKKRMFETAQAELKSWSQAFRQIARQQKTTVRYFAGDALAFAHTLQYCNQPQARSAGHYVNNWTFTPLSRSGEHCLQRSRCASVLFDVVDTSNLGDHLGTLNLLIATAPLLRLSPASTIYTEVLVQHEASIKSTLDSILCGDFNSMTMLLGLTVVETWTNATTSVESDQILFNISSKTSDDRKEDSEGGQIRTQIPWKLTSTLTQHSINAEPSALAKFLHDIYNNMFTHESIQRVLAPLKLSGLKKVSNPYYNRASFVAVLRFMRNHIKTDWSLVFASLVTLIENDDVLSIGRNYLQELHVYLYALGLHTVDMLSKAPFEVLKETDSGPLVQWSRLPTMVAVTIEVPRTKIEFFSRMKVGTSGIPSFCCSLQSAPTSRSQWLTQFGAVQSGFGHVRVVDNGTAGEHNLIVSEDEKGWNGNSPLVVSFYTPTWILLQEGNSTLIAVGFQATPHTAWAYLKTLGPRLQIFNTRLDDHCIYISKHMPQQHTHPAIIPRISNRAEKQSTFPHVSQSTLSINFDTSWRAISSISCKIDLQGKAQETLANKGAVVRVKQNLATSVDILVGDSISWVQPFPAPISAVRSKLRIARKSSYVEVIAPFLSPLHSDKIDDFVYPVLLPLNTVDTTISPVGLCAHTVNLDVSPLINDRQPSKLDWMTFHTTAMFSKRERSQRDGGPVTAFFEDKRVDFKDGLFSIFMHSTGVQGQKARVFGLHKDRGGVDTIVFVSVPRLDLNDRVVVLDAAVIPLQHSIVRDPLFRGVITKIQDHSPPLFIMVKVDEDELKIWKSILPALSERCRTWKHLKSCEYIKHNTIPLPGGLEGGNTPLCSCGLGKMPADFMKGAIGDIPKLDRLLRKYAIRIALSPVYHVAYVEDAFDIDQFYDRRNRNLDASPASGSARTANDTQCAACRKTETSLSTALLKCSRCKAVKYCSKDCQKRHWKDHKPNCYTA